MTEGDDFAAEAQAATEQFIADNRAKRETPEADTVAATAEQVRQRLTDGGRVEVTLRSRGTGEHVTVLLTAKKKGADGRYISRATIAGRVGIKEAHAIWCDDPHEEFGANNLGLYYLDNVVVDGEHEYGPGYWYERRGAEPNRAWAAEHVIRWALGDYPLAHQAEVFMATTCSYCGHKLTDPESIERGIGPECYGRHTESQAAERQHALLRDQ